jgi:glycosyltransferase involved in cell wall biosynthesis
MKSKKHVCICYHVYPPINGGAELAIQKISEDLIRRGYQVSVLCSDRNKRNQNVEYINGVRVIYVKSYFDIFKVPFAPSYYFQLLKLRPDIIHAHGSMPGYSDVAIFFAALHHVPSILTYKFDGNAENIVGSICAYIYNHTINKFVVSLADRITATGLSYVQTSPVLKNVIQKVTIIPNGLDLKQFTYKSKTKQSQIKTILWVGRFVKYKGLEYLIRSMDYVENAHLMIIGSGILENTLKNLVKRKKLQNKITFIGHIDNSKLASYYQKADLYVLSSISRGENFGSSALEALGCGTPVVATDLPGVCDLITDDVGIRVSPKNPKSIAKAINTLLSNDDLRNILSVNAVKKAQNYSWNIICDKYFEQYTLISNRAEKTV